MPARLCVTTRLFLLGAAILLFAAPYAPSSSWLTGPARIWAAPQAQAADLTEQAGQTEQPGESAKPRACAAVMLEQAEARKAGSVKRAGRASGGARQAVLLDPALVREGDVLFQVTNSPQCKAIQMATGSRYTHCGIVLERNGQLQVFEAVRTVSWSPLQEWVRRGVNNHYVLMRLKDPSPLNPERLAAMREDAKFFSGRGYDLLFQWSDEEIYCSELVWKLYERNIGLQLGPLRTFRDYNLDHEEVRRIANARFGKDIPLDTKVTAPSDIMASDLLEVVAKN